MAGMLEDEKLRFQLELEFVQCLANPTYLQYLAQQRFFEDQAFINYLGYLMYWKRPEYAKYIQYPYCLAMLDLLQQESFRKACASADTAALLHKAEYFHWEAYRARAWAPAADDAHLRALTEVASAPPEAAADRDAQAGHDASDAHAAAGAADEPAGLARQAAAE
nr:hypothetical protein HK105_007336 [Polyrhizophydium stewartii]